MAVWGLIRDVSHKMLDWVIVKAQFDHEWFSLFETDFRLDSLGDPCTEIPQDGTGPKEFSGFL